MDEMNETFDYSRNVTTNIINNNNWKTNNNNNRPNSPTDFDINNIAPSLLLIKKNSERDNEILKSPISRRTLNVSFSGNCQYYNYL